MAGSDVEWVSLPAVRHTEGVTEIDGFDDWNPRMRPQTSDDDVVPPASVQWLLDMFPGALLRHNQKTAAEEALTAILDDVERAGGVRPWMELLDNNGLRVMYLLGDAIAERPATGVGGSSLTEALVEVAAAAAAPPRP